MRILSQSGSDIRGGQDEGSMTEIVWACEEEMCGCPSKEVRRGRQKKY